MRAIDLCKADNKRFDAHTLLAARFTATELKEARFIAKELKDGGSTAAELLAAGYAVKDLKTAEYDIADVKRACVNNKEQMRDVYSVRDLHNAGYGLRELIEMGCSIRDIRTETTVTAKQARDAGLEVKQLQGGGYTKKDLVECGYSISELRAGGFTCSELRVYGKKSVIDLLAGGYPHADVKREFQIDDVARQLKDTQRASELMRGGFGYTVDELLHLLQPEDFKRAGCNVRDLLGKLPMPDMKKLFSDGELRNHIKTPDDMKDFGYGVNDFYQSGWTIDQIRTLKRNDQPALYLWAEHELKNAGVSAPWICTVGSGLHVWGSGIPVVGTAQNKCTVCKRVQAVGICEHRDPSKQVNSEKH